jgi:hypothetical protein
MLTSSDADVPTSIRDIAARFPDRRSAIPVGSRYKMRA